MVLHDLATLGTADVVPRKSLTLRINLSWEQFSLKFAAPMADLSTGSIMLIQEALISKKEVKIKKEGDELDALFARVAAAAKAQSPGACPNCGYKLEKPRETCPQCGSVVAPPKPARFNCTTCGKPLEAGWKCCPFCCTPV